MSASLSCLEILGTSLKNFIIMEIINYILLIDSFITSLETMISKRDWLKDLSYKILD